ncbi:MAG: CTP synthase (glutamine hydrolyzing) [Thermoplasmata archaeon]|nr:CTP synthase (glutamine hydrolyzing) [Thermoplasmata archaeon]RLF54165.1 MAG: CTP synthetase [Thermoplasmata archaeon]RLF69818.1 MAG: CTP synthetase [Thermoplasmata archaeon]RLF70195.1 MAG: CTP synthetase [Thermoplasmata archaeon]HDD60070.1 CTP synthase (glutamine hydrolyzing) [Euryarchaeota archaeon]
MKYVIVTGGVLSGLGKGITTSSIGVLLKSAGLKVTAIKIDPYLNCDAGTMNPYEHGEVFVLDDGGEVDLDLGNYERFLNIDLSSEHNITTGKIYRSVIEKERVGRYLGKTVQIVPHVVDEIKNTIRRVAKKSKADVCLIEVGGTVGDIESMPFLEALRQLKREEPEGDVLFVHVTLVPVMGVVGEQKTKPTQHSVKELRSIGIQPDIIVCRSDKKIVKKVKSKISLFCDVPEEAVISAHDVSNIYEVPLLIHEQGITDYILKKLGLHGLEVDLGWWQGFVERLSSVREKVKVALVGKYTGLKDSYISYIRAFEHAGAEEGVEVELVWIDAPEDDQPDFEEKVREMYRKLENVDAILVPGGFGQRGIEGKIRAITFARERKIPFLGVCLGFQLSVIEFARGVMGLERANSTEFDPETPHPVVDLLPEQRSISQMGATMRLGRQKAIIKPGTMAYRLYRRKFVWERHRHRYEINPTYVEAIESAGFIFSGVSPDGQKMEIGEMRDHPFFMGCQFHPEFKSRPGHPSPMYVGLLKAAKKYKKERERG